MPIRHIALLCALLLGACNPNGQQASREAGGGAPSPVVLIQARRASHEGAAEWTPLGSGFVVSDDGHVVTAYHVIESYEALLERAPPGVEIRLVALPALAEGGAVHAEDTAHAPAWPLVRVAENAENDLAVLRIVSESEAGQADAGGERPLAVARLALARPELGTAIQLAGYPFGEHTLVERPGHLVSSSAFGEPTPALRQPAWFQALLTGSFLLAEVETHFGNSGGPVFRADSGVVIGMCSAILSLQVSQPGAEGNPPTQNAARFTLVIPTRTIVDLLDSQEVVWHTAH